MGKKLSEASLKISKNHQTQQQMSSMIKALRPKVYITHSSRFKKLVQDLTGNNITVRSSKTTTMSCSSSPTSVPPKDDVHITDNLETSFDSSEVSASSSATSYSSSSEFCCYNNQTCLKNEIFTLGSSEANQWMMDNGMLEYQNNLESLFFDAEVEGNFLYDYGYAQPEQEVSTYECDLWGLL